MSREMDLKWFLENRKALAADLRGAWVVILGGKVVGKFVSEEEAFSFSVEKYGIEEASIFQATERDTVLHIG